MKIKWKQRLIALLFVLCMVGNLVPVNTQLDVEAASSATTINELIEEGFAPWTFSDLEIADQKITSGKHFNWDKSAWQVNSAGDTLDKTIFGGKIQFAADSTNFGNFYIGGDIKDSSASDHRGFVLRGFNDSNPNLTFGFLGDDGIFYNKDGKSNEQIVIVYKEDLTYAIRGNRDLELAISVEYLDVSNGKVTMQVGLFFQGQLYNDTYYTVKDVPEKYLTRSFRWYNPQGTNAIRSTSLVDITLETAPERNFAEWTFSDAGIPDTTGIKSSINWDEFNTTDAGASLNRSIFCGKVNFDGDVENFGEFYIGGNYVADTSKYRGLRFSSYGTTDKLALGFCGPDGYFYNQNGNTQKASVTESSQIVIFNPIIAGTDLRENPSLQIAVSVEYLSDVAADGTVDIKVGVFFDGTLYNNEYYTVKGIPTNLLTQNTRFYMASASSGTTNDIYSDYVEDITLVNAPERCFAEWTYSDLGVTDGNGNWDNTTKISDSLHQTLFRAKIKFNTGDTLIGGVGDTTTEGGSKWRGIRFDVHETDQVMMSFQGPNGVFYNAKGSTKISNAPVSLVNFNKNIAGVDLVGNKDLEVAVSVEYLSPESETTDIKIGVFFNGKLYNNTYYFVGSVPVNHMHQNVVTQTSVTASHITGIYSVPKATIILDDAPENDFTYWSFRDINWSDRTTTEAWGWNDGVKNSTSLDKTIFHGKILFPADDTKFRLYIGGNPVNDTSSWRGFFFRHYSTGMLSLSFVGTDEKWYDENGGVLGTDPSAGPFLVMDPEIAGTTLRGNADLQVSLSVECGEVKDTGLVDVKVGVFFDGALYNNQYCTLKDVDPAYLTQNVRWKNDNAATISFASRQKETNVAENGAMAYTSHSSNGAEYTGYGAATLIDGVAGENDPYFRSADGAGMQKEGISATVELADVYSVDHIRLYHYEKAGGFPTDFTIEALTKEGWTLVKEISSYEARKGWNTFGFAETICTAVRVTTATNGATQGGYGLNLGEFEVYGVSALGDVEIPYTQAKEGVVLVPGQRERTANDGILTGADGHRLVTANSSDVVRIQTIFKTTIDVNSVQIHTKNAGDFGSNVVIYAFDGTNWNNVYENTNYTCGTGQTMHEFNFDASATCTSIMVVVSGLPQLYEDYGIQVQEMRVHGYRSDASCRILGDIYADGDITEEIEGVHMRKVLVGADGVNTSVHTDLNYDQTTGVKDLIRLKRYLSMAEGIVRTYDLSCMTWNVLNCTSDGYADPEVRAPYIAQEILTQNKDIVGLQEAGGVYYNWPEYLDQQLVTNGPYNSIKISDSSTYINNCQEYKNNASKMNGYSGLIIYYKADRFTLQDYGSQMYTKSPILDTGKEATAWFMWAKFLDKESGESIYMTNTHWSPNVNSAGEQDMTAGATYHAQQSKELREYWKNNIGDNLMFATGDYNAVETTDAIKYMNEGIYEEANVLLGYNGSLKSHIDHIFVHESKMDVKNYKMELPTFTGDDGTEYKYSDHAWYATEVTYRK